MVESFPIRLECPPLKNMLDVRRLFKEIPHFNADIFSDISAAKKGLEMYFSNVRALFEEFPAFDIRLNSDKSRYLLVLGNSAFYCDSLEEIGILAHFLSFAEVAEMSPVKISPEKLH